MSTKESVKGDCGLQSNHCVIYTYDERIPVLSVLEALFKEEVDFHQIVPVVEN